MSLWEKLFAGRSLRPDEVSLVAGTDLLDPRVGDWLQAAFGVGEGAESRETAALNRLLVDPERSMRELESAYARIPAQDYAVRWALVYAVGQLNTPAALPFLAQIVQTEIPPEQSNDIHHFSTRAEETSQRCQAVRGIGLLASGGHDGALTLLLEQLSHSDFTIRVIACQVLRGMPTRSVSDDEIHRRLPSDEADRVLAIRQFNPEDLEPLIEGTVTITLPPPPFDDVQEDAGHRPPV